MLLMVQAASIAAAYFLTKKLSKKIVYPGIFIAQFVFGGGLDFYTFTDTALNIITCALLTGVIACVIELKSIKQFFLEKKHAKYIAAIKGTVEVDGAGAVDTSAMSFNYGKIVSAATGFYTTSEVVVGKDVFGNASASTINTVHETHKYWIHDEAQNREIKFTGVGEVPGREGHTIGVASVNGESKFEWNFTIGQTYSTKRPQSPLLQSLFLTFVFFFFGCVMVPLALIVRWGNKTLPTAGGWAFPGGSNIDLMATLTLAGFTILEYLLFWGAIESRSTSMAIFALCLLIPEFALVYMYMKKVSAAFEKFKLACFRKLELMHDEFVARSQAASKLDNVTAQPELIG